MENGKCAYHSPEWGRQREREGTELSGTVANLMWSGVKVAADRESLSFWLGWVYMVAPELRPELPLSVRLSIFISTKCFWLWQPEEGYKEWEREQSRGKYGVKKNLKLQLPPDKKGVDLHISVCLLCGCCSEVVPPPFLPSCREWLPPTPLAEMTWPNKMASSLCAVNPCQ